MSQQDDDLRDEVNNAIGDDEIDDSAEHDQDDINDDDAPDETDDQEDDSADDDDSDQDDSDQRSKSGKQTTRSAPADDIDAEDEDDDPSIDYARPDFNQGSVVAKEFDIRTLPKDPETGLIDPIEANKLINEWRNEQGQSSQENQRKVEETKNLLQQQWVRVSKKYPAVYKNPRLRDLARDTHLNSIGTQNYLTPAQAAAKVERMRRELTKTGYKSAKTRRSVEKMTRTERGSGRSDSGKQSDYDKAKTMANSRDPAKAKQGRMTMLRLRREARRRNG